MNEDLIQRLQYSYAGQNGTCALPSPLKDSLQIISDYFATNSGNKLCLVFPTREFTAQWLSVPTVLFLIENDFEQFHGEIFESFRQYKPGEKLILNNLAIVEWVGLKINGVAFKTKAGKDSSGAEITIKFSDVIKLQKAPSNRKALSSIKLVKEAFPARKITPIEQLLNIDTYGNKEFIKNKVCLVTRYKSFDDSINNVEINHSTLSEYFKAGKIDENGIVDINSPLLLANNLSNLALYLVGNPIKKIVIDGFAAIQERGTDFSDIDVKDIPTILITDLSEISSFEYIGNYGFDFFNFTKENLNLDHQPDDSPFNSFNKKLKKYIHFNVVKEICHNEELEIIVQKIHSIEKDESNNDLNILKISLIQLTNIISRICHIPTAYEIAVLNQKLNAIETLFLRNKLWLGDSNKPIEISISLLKALIEKHASQPSEKCVRLETLMDQCKYDYIICPTEEEVQTLRNFLTAYPHNIRVISAAGVNDDLLSGKPLKAIITGWSKSSYINRFLSSFLFSELTVLFYQFENRYYNSLQRRNKKNNDYIRSTISNNGIRSVDDPIKSEGFTELYSDGRVTEIYTESSFDILEFELKLDSAQYSKYAAQGNLIESIKAKRVDFENDFFVYSSESHKFLLINELIDQLNEKPILHRKRIDTLKPGDVIALINTDRDILAELVDKNTKKRDLEAVKQWTDLWRNLLKEYFVSIGNDFKRLVDDLRKYGCKKHDVTIRTWIQDENRIGPDEDSDLISIALMTDSKLLYENIEKVREAISKMTGWRMKASDFITEKIKAQMHELACSSIINKKISIEGLGSVCFSKVIEISSVWENIDFHYVNRLLQKEII